MYLYIYLFFQTQEEKHGHLHHLLSLDPSRKAASTPCHLLRLMVTRNHRDREHPGAMEPIFGVVSVVRPSQLRSIHQGNIDCSFDNLRALNSSSPLASTSFSLLYPFSFVNGTHGPSVIVREQEWWKRFKNELRRIPKALIKKTGGVKGSFPEFLEVTKPPHTWKPFSVPAWKS